MDAVKALADLLREAGVRPLLGLRQQGHMPTVERMLKEGATWGEIGKAIGWVGKAVKESYRMETTLEAGAAAYRERVYDLATRMAEDPHSFFAIPLDRSRAEYCSMALRELLRRLEEPTGTAADGAEVIEP